jgi:hypothetical protein
MKSNKQRQAELDTRRKARAAKSVARHVVAIRMKRMTRGVVPVNKNALAPNSSYGEPEFVTGGYYSDQPFVCLDCGESEVWTAEQQKWWYEVAKGDVFTTARRCRLCRRRERERRNEARRIHLEGLARKQKRA